MNHLRISLLAVILSLCPVLSAQEIPVFQPYWQIGVGLGELPMGGSFKPSISLGYQFNEKLYTGIIYQLPDRISRDKSSFNARSTGLDGLTSSNESVAQRFLFQVRYTPF